MEVTTKKSMHPLIAIAAVSVTLFSLVGIGAITGLIPTSHSQTAPAAAPVQEPAKLAETAQSAESTPAAATPVSAPKPATHKVAVVKHTKPVVHATHSAEEPMKVAKADEPVAVAQTPYPPPHQPAPYIEPAKPVCHECGVIELVREIEKPGQATGSGAAIGGIAGGVLGNQAGRGNGRTVMTILGAIGGAFAGNAVEKNTKKAKSYEIAIRFDDGSTQLITQDTPPAWRSGDRVRLVNGAITAYNG